MDQGLTTVHTMTIPAPPVAHILGLVIAILPLFSNGHANGAEVQRACCSAAEVRAIVNGALMKIQSIHITYTAKANINNAIGDYVAREIMCTRPCFVYHRGAHGNLRQSWEDDLELQRAWIQKDRYYNEYPWRRSYFFDDLAPTAQLPGTLQYDSWFQCSSCWPIDREPPKVWGVTSMLHEVAASDDYEFVRPQLEEVQGRLCHVLERRGLDALWIDCERPPGLMRRKAWDPKTGDLVGHVELADHRQVAEGVWIAFLYRNRFFNNRSESPENPSTDYTLLVSEASVNDVNPAVFHFTPPKGAISFPAEFRRRGELRIAPGGLDHIDRVVGWINRNHHIDEPKMRSWKSYVVFLASGGLCAWILLRRCCSRPTVKVRESNRE